MGAKRFGAVVTTPGVNTLIMTGQSGKDSIVVLNIANQGATPTAVRVAYMSGNVVASITNADYLVYDYMINNGDFLQLKGIAVEAGYSLVVLSVTNPVSAVAYGMESSSI